MKAAHILQGWPASLTLMGVLALPVSRQTLEAHMATHMLLQIPLLAIAGVLIAHAVAARLQCLLESYDRQGLSGMLIVLFASSYWMLPRALDAVLASPVMELGKFCSLPLLVGLPLALSWQRVGPIGRSFVLANVISMVAVAAGCTGNRP